MRGGRAAAAGAIVPLVLLLLATACARVPFAGPGGVPADLTGANPAGSGLEAFSKQMGQAPAGPTAPEGASGRVEPAMLRLSIRWPAASEAPYRVAVLPESVRRVLVRVFAGDAELARQELVRSGDAAGTAAEASFRLLPRDNVRVEVEALGTPLPEEQEEVAVARGSASGLNLASSRLVTARITMVPVDQPLLTRLGQNIGQPGSVLELFGRNLRPATVVSFGGVKAGPVTWISGGALRVTVPDGAMSGRLTVVTDGVPVASDAWFWVLESLGLMVPARESWDDGTLDYVRQARFGSDVRLEARPVWRISDPDATASVAPPEDVQWLSSDERAGSFVAPGRFRCGTQRVPTTVVAALGPYLSGGFRIEPAGAITGLRLASPAVALYSRPAVGESEPGYPATASVGAVVDHTLPRSPALDCSSSDPSLVTCTDGVLSTTRAQRDGLVVVTVGLRDLPDLRASMSVQVHASGSMQVVIE